VELDSVPPGPVPEPNLTVTNYSKNKMFDEAIFRFAQYRNEGRTKKDIPGILHEKGYKTITCRDWKPGNISRTTAMNGMTAKRRKIVGACLFFCCLTVSGNTDGLQARPQISEQNASDVTVTYGNLGNEAIYSISSENCTIDWIARDSEIGVVLHRSRCKASLPQQIPLLKQIYTEFLKKEKNASAFRTLYWGRLAPDGSRPEFLELSQRLARAAHKSPDWDVKRGRPKNGDLNGFVKDLANRQMIYPELKELFEGFHKHITFCCVEKVLVQAAGKLSFFEQLKPHGIQASDKLPFDCMAWFSVSASDETVNR
jgi:hypothetical protein